MCHPKRPETRSIDTNAPTTDIPNGFVQSLDIVSVPLWYGSADRGRRSHHGRPQQNWCCLGFRSSIEVRQSHFTAGLHQPLRAFSRLIRDRLAAEQAVSLQALTEPTLVFPLGDKA